MTPRSSDRREPRSPSHGHGARDPDRARRTAAGRTSPRRRAAGSRRLLQLCASLLVCAAATVAHAEPRLATERAVLHTSLGDLILAFYPDVAPRHVEQILRLMRLGVYDGTSFYRVQPSFVAQLTTAQARRRPLTAAQSAAIHPIAAEFSDLRHVRGVLSMAHEDGKPDSGETSFSILLGPAPHLDGNYTIFGRIDGSDAVLDAIARVPRDDQNRPLTPIEIARAEVVDTPEALARLARRTVPAAQAESARGAAGQPSAVSTTTGGGRPATPFLALVGVMMIFSLASFFFAGRASARVVGSLGLLSTLVGAFLLYTSLAPISSSSPWLAVPLFVASIGLFKLMSWFESEPKRKAAVTPGARVSGPNRPST